MNPALVSKGWMNALLRFLLRREPQTLARGAPLRLILDICDVKKLVELIPPSSGKIIFGDFAVFRRGGIRSNRFSKFIGI